MDDIIKKIIDEAELKSKEINNLLNILSNDKKGVSYEKLYSIKILIKIKEYYKHRIFNLKKRIISFIFQIL